MRVIHVGVTSWLVIDDVYRPRYVVVYGPAVQRSTGETHMLYRVDHHALERERRRPLAWHETLSDTIEWCRAQIEMPDMDAPIRDDYGSAVTRLIAIEGVVGV